MDHASAARRTRAMVERAVQVRQGLAGLTTQSPWIGQKGPFGIVGQIIDNRHTRTSSLGGYG